MKKRKSGLGKKGQFTHSSKHSTPRPQRHNSPSRGRTQSAKRKRLNERNSVTTKKKQTLSRVTRAISVMRSGASLRKAARESGVAPRTVLKRAASALRKNRSGRYAAKSSDRLERPLLVPTPEGPRAIAVRGLRDASRLSRYWRALHEYYATGDRRVQEFEGQSITDINGEKIPLITDLAVLDRLGSAGVLSFESLYAWSE